MTMQPEEKSRQQGEGDGGIVIKILLAGGERLVSLATGLWTLSEAEIHQADSGKEVMNLLSEKQFELVVIDEVLEDMNGLELAQEVAYRQPFVNCILVDGGPHEIFHEKTEGLGVLMQLPSPPEMADAKTILHHLAAIRACR